MICNACGMQYEGAFCPHCGAQAAASVIPEKNPGEKFGKIGMILGIVSTALIVIFGWCGYFGLFASALAFDAAIAALVFSIIGKNRSKNVGKLNPQAKLGMIFSIVTMGIFMLAMFVIFALITVAMIFGVGGSVFSITDMMSNGYYY